MGYKSFEEMPLWQEAHGLAVEIHEVTATFPRHELDGLTSQLRRAAVSVGANVAEAFGRYHYRDKLRFYYNSTRSRAIFSTPVTSIISSPTCSTTWPSGSTPSYTT